MPMTRPITPSMVYELTAVADPSLSPDGRKLAYVRSAVDGDSLESQSRIFKKEMPDGAEMQFTAGADRKSVV